MPATTTPHRAARPVVCPPIARRRPAPPPTRRTALAGEDIGESTATATPPPPPVGAAALGPGLPALDAATDLDSIPPGLNTPPTPPDPGRSSPFFPSLSPVTRGVLALHACAALFGSNQVCVKAAEAAASPALTSAVRFGLAAALFAPAAVKGLSDPPTRRAGLELGAWLAVGYGLQAAGLAASTAARGSLTGVFTVFTVPALAAGLGGLSVQPAVWWLALLSGVGVALLTGAGGPPPGPADAALIGSALIFGVHKWRSGDASIAAGAAVDSEAASAGLTGVQLAVLAVVAGGAAAPEVWEGGLGALVGPGSGFPWLPLVYMGVLTTGLTLRWEVDALKVVPAHTASLIFSSELVWGAAGAWVLGGERWGAAGWAGAAAVAAASVGAAVLGVGEEGQKAE